MPRADAYAMFKLHLAEIHDLGKVTGLLGWDQQTMMPPRGADARVHQIGTMTRLTHDRIVANETRRLLDAAEQAVAAMPAESDEASLVRVARRDVEKVRRVPTELAVEMATASARAFPAWVEAKKTSDFDGFLPHLERALDLRRRYAACFDDVAEPYDALLDDFEPGITTAEVAALFATLKAGLVPLVAWIRERADAVDDAPVRGVFPVEDQRQFAIEVISWFGYSPDAWRVDPAAHPFASSMAIGDIRLTTRFDERHLNQGLFATMHECGHGLYEHGVDPSLERTPLARGASLGLHESQSRTWENLVGRGRPFWRHAFPLLQKRFPEQFAGLDEESVYRAVNKMAPSLIRVEADEATYNLHIIMRFELEQALLDGSLPPRDLPEAWRSRMVNDIGIEVPDHGHGVLQDVHWADGLFGYFPTYALGNMMAAQLHERAASDLPDLADRFAAGDFSTFREWHRERIHRHGRKFTAPEIMTRAVGQELTPGPLLRYLRAKITDLYGEPPAPATA
jgi:carboxypeptidase Taq